jgi:hypothetical protein
MTTNSHGTVVMHLVLKTAGSGYWKWILVAHRREVALPSGASGRASSNPSDKELRERNAVRRGPRFGPSAGHWAGSNCVRGHRVQAADTLLMNMALGCRVE